MTWIPVSLNKLSVDFSNPRILRYSLLPRTTPDNSYFISQDPVRRQMVPQTSYFEEGLIMDYLPRHRWGLRELREDNVVLWVRNCGELMPSWPEEARGGGSYWNPERGALGRRLPGRAPPLGGGWGSPSKHLGREGVEGDGRDFTSSLLWFQPDASVGQILPEARRQSLMQSLPAKHLGPTLGWRKVESKYKRAHRR